MVLDEGLLGQARDAAIRLTDAQHATELAKADYHHAVRRLHLTGASLREIADALDLSHQRVHQIVESSGGGVGWKSRKRMPDDLTCTFCGLPSTEVSKIISGPGVYICDGCVPQAGQVIREAVSVTVRGTQLDPVPNTSTLDCSFCGQSASKVDQLAAAPGVRICGTCVELCEEILEAQGL